MPDNPLDASTRIRNACDDFLRRVPLLRGQAYPHQRDRLEDGAGMATSPCMPERFPRHGLTVESINNALRAVHPKPDRFPVHPKDPLYPETGIEPREEQFVRRLLRVADERLGGMTGALGAELLDFVMQNRDTLTKEQLEQLAAITQHADDTAEHLRDLVGDYFKYTEKQWHDIQVIEDLRPAYSRHRETRGMPSYRHPDSPPPPKD